MKGTIVKSHFSVKGGTGKTTLNTCLASYIHDQGFRCLALDGDSPSYNLFHFREREVAAYQESPEVVDKYIMNSSSIYPIYKIGTDEMQIEELLRIKESGQYDYIVADLPGSLTNTIVNKLIVSGFVDEFYLPTTLDKAVIVNNIKAATQLKKFSKTVKIVWNNVLFHEKQDIYDDNTKVISDAYGIDVCTSRIKSSSYLRREFGNDKLFIKSTLCFPTKLIEEKNNSLINYFKEIVKSQRLSQSIGV